ncbi:uncharacterized protein [Parasteatoda tepidariorum]|uniref:uncharacterized protein isoform X2 n=1 Tax=Parasteatoda tepidariorum TaxID=114398 RepID=UPI0039BD0C59
MMEIIHFYLIYSRYHKKIHPFLYLQDTILSYERTFLPKKNVLKFGDSNVEETETKVTKNIILSKSSTMMSKDIEIKRRNSKVREGGKNLIAILKCIGFILCVTGFSYQVSEFMVRFYSHPTVVNIDINETPKFVVPALTFCNLNPIRRSTYCNENPDNCEKPADIQQFCLDMPHYCRQEDMSQFLMPKNHIYSRMTLEELEKYGQIETESFIPYFWLDNKTESDYFEQTWEHHNDFDLVPCFKLYSRENSNERAKMGTFFPRVLNVASRQVFILNVEEDELFDPRKNPRAVLDIHSPFAVSDIELKAINLEPGKSYKIHIILVEYHLLPAPYKTDCIDYEDLWEKNNRTGPRSQRSCMLICTDVLTRLCLNCTQEIYAPLRDKCTGNYAGLKDCVGNFTDSVREEYQKCDIQCKKECVKRIYDIRVEESSDFIYKEIDRSGYINNRTRGSYF